MDVGSGPGQWRRVLEKGGEQMDPGEVGNPMGEVWEGMGLQRGGGACEGWRSNSGGESEWVGDRGGDGGGTQTEVRTPSPGCPRLRCGAHSH